MQDIIKPIAIFIIGFLIGAIVWSARAYEVGMTAEVEYNKCNQCLEYCK